jgi:hypothetical protein
MACSTNGREEEWVEKPEGNKPLGRAEVGGWILLRWIIKR